MATSTTRAPGTSRADLITDAALALLAERGMRGLTHRAVDERAGLPRARRPTTPAPGRPCWRRRCGDWRSARRRCSPRANSRCRAANRTAECRGTHRGPGRAGRRSRTGPAPVSDPPPRAADLPVRTRPGSHPAAGAAGVFRRDGPPVPRTPGGADDGGRFGRTGAARPVPGGLVRRADVLLRRRVVPPLRTDRGRAAHRLHRAVARNARAPRAITSGPVMITGETASSVSPRRTPGRRTRRSGRRRSRAPGRSPRTWASTTCRSA